MGDAPLPTNAAPQQPVNHSSNGEASLSTRGIRGHMDYYVLTYFAPISGLLERHGSWSEQNQSGAMILSVAENRLTIDPVAKRLAAPIHLVEEDMAYPDNTGRPELRKAFARYLEHTQMQGLSIDPDHLSLLAGGGCILDTLSFALMDAGDVVLVPIPYYPAFDNDLMVRNQVAPLPVHLRSDTPQSFEDQLEAASISAKLGGRRVRGLLICHPDNPTGRMYSRERLKEMLQWAAKRQMHIICDEIYGNSVFGDGEEMVSAAHVLQDLPDEQQAALTNYLHIVFGLSKDWCAGGLRVGGLWSRNAALRSVILNVGYFQCISSLTSRAVTDMLSDLTFVDAFLLEMRSTLKRAYTTLTGLLTDIGVPFTPAVAGIFLWVDLRGILSDATWEAEDALWHALIDECALLFTPGKSCHSPEPGFFRICYAAVPVSGMEELVKRLGNFWLKRQATQQQATAMELI